MLFLAVELKDSDKNAALSFPPVQSASDDAD